ncbi:MAG: hypothetical protein ABIL15_04585 [candidate division WOR-3 bacterium]
MKGVKMKNLLIIIFVTIMVLVNGCGTVIQYSLIRVPQEGGIKFTKITDEEDGVRWPVTINMYDKIEWVPREFFDISKDGLKIAFMGWKNNKGNLFVKDLRGGKATLQRTFRDNVIDVSFSPDGKWLAFAEYREWSWNIYMIGAEAGSAIRQITTGNLPELYPVFSPDGKYLLFVQTERSIYNIEEEKYQKKYLWTYDLEKGILTQYAEGSAPSFTPDGKSVIVQRVNNETGFIELWLVNLENGQEFLIISSKERSFTNPCVSPDGKKIACVSCTGAEHTPANLDIYLVNIDGTDLTQITFHPGHDVCPRWSPDGHSIYFLSQRGSEKGEWNIWKMDLK